MGCIEQFSIDENGDRILKKRVTHDQSMCFSPDGSVNKRTIAEALPEIQFGFALKRFIAVIIALRTLYPDKPILMYKCDLKSAYRRVHSHASTAVQTIVSLKDICLNFVGIALMALRLCFGGSPCAPLFANLSELICDLCNELAKCESWDSRDHPSNYDPYIASPEFLSDDVPFAEALPTLVSLPVGPNLMTEVYIDDFFSAFVALSDDQIHRCSRVIPFVLDAIGRPLDPQERSLIRDWLLCLEKHLAEGTPREIMTTLGWFINTRSLTIGLPRAKFIDWRREFLSILNN
jgi:hypothetical protein